MNENMTAETAAVLLCPGPGPGPGPSPSPAPVPALAAGLPWPDLSPRSPLLAGLAPSSRLAYSVQLRQYQGWTLSREIPWSEIWSRQSVTSWALSRAEQGLKARTIQQGLYAVKYLAKELLYANLITAEQEQSVRSAKPSWGAKFRGGTTGRWLTQEELERMVQGTMDGTVQGKRDGALLALMAGAGLRCMEAARLTPEQVQQRDGRMVLVDVTGKHGRVRTVPVPGWAAGLLQQWQEELQQRQSDSKEVQSAGLGLGLGPAATVVLLEERAHSPALALVPCPTPAQKRALLRPLSRGVPKAQGMSRSAVWLAVSRIAARSGVRVSPHDLRRTFARLSRAGGADLSQVQLALGHQTVTTTERYVGAGLDLANAACDRIRLDLNLSSPPYPLPPTDLALRSSIPAPTGQLPEGDDSPPSLGNV